MRASSEFQLVLMSPALHNNLPFVGLTAFHIIFQGLLLLCKFVVLMDFFFQMLQTCSTK